MDGEHQPLIVRNLMNHRHTLRSIDVRDIYHQEYFLQRVDGYDRFAQFDGTTKTLFERARRNLELLDIHPGEYFLDLGCGRGEVAIAAGFIGAIAVGCDFSHDAIVLAQQKMRSIEQNSGRNIRTSFMCAIATENMFRPNSFDKVLMSEFIEHVSPQERDVILRNVRRWLKPGGKVLIYTFPNRWSRYTYPLMRWYVRIRNGVDMGERPDDTTHPDYTKYHLNEQSYFSLYFALRRAGFREVHVWFDSHSSGRFSIIKRTFLYNLLFGSNLTGVGIK